MQKNRKRHPEYDIIAEKQADQKPGKCLNLFSRNAVATFDI